MGDGDSVYWVLQPDTLPAKADLHRYLHDSFFEHDSVCTAEVSTKGYGVAGDPVPYKLRSDNTVTLLLVVSFIVFSVSLAHSQHFITRQLKNFFFIQRNADDEPVGETSGEVRFQLFLVVVGCLLVALAGYMYVVDGVSQTFVLDNDSQLIALLFAATLAFTGVKALLYTMVGHVFFDGKKNIQFLKSVLFIYASASVLLFPIVMLMIYFDLSVQSATYLLGFVLIMVKILSFYKCWVIFFRQKGGVLQTFLYFCTLEATPLLAFGGLMVVLIDFLKINF